MVQNRHNDAILVARLLTLGVSPTSSGRDGTTAVHVAAAAGSLSALEVLLRNGVDPNIKDVNGDLPIHAATTNGKAECLNLLLKFGANPNALDHSHYSALHWAAYTGQLECAKVLLDNNADVFVRDRFNRTPKEWAVQYQSAPAILQSLTAAETNTLKRSGPRSALPVGSVASPYAQISQQPKSDLHPPSHPSTLDVPADKLNQLPFQRYHSLPPPLAMRQTSSIGADASVMHDPRTHASDMTLNHYDFDDSLQPGELVTKPSATVLDMDITLPLNTDEGDVNINASENMQSARREQPHHDSKTTGSPRTIIFSPSSPLLHRTSVPVREQLTPEFATLTMTPEFETDTLQNAPPRLDSQQHALDRGPIVRTPSSPIGAAKHLRRVPSHPPSSHLQRGSIPNFSTTPDRAVHKHPSLVDLPPANAHRHSLPVGPSARSHAPVLQPLHQQQQQVNVPGAHPPYPAHVTGRSSAPQPYHNSNAAAHGRPLSSGSGGPPVSPVKANMVMNDQTNVTKQRSLPQVNNLIDASGSSLPTSPGWSSLGDMSNTKALLDQIADQKKTIDHQRHKISALEEAASSQQNKWQAERNDLHRKLQQQRDELDMAHRQLSEMHALNSSQNTLMSFGYNECVLATNNWAPGNKIGEGGFGPVYRGVLHGQAVAIKSLAQDSHQGHLEFARELDVLSKYRHRHLVPLMGIVHEPDHLCLIYEYMEHGSLRDRLDCKNNTPPLDWLTRVTVAFQSAQGLLFLHRGTTPPVLHLDFKSLNVLLDKGYVAKVADFGLVRPMPELMGKTHVTTRRLNGTHGYICPEYAASGRITDKTDVYSFGVVMLELVTGLPAVSQSLNPPQLCLRVKDFIKGTTDAFRQSPAQDKQGHAHGSDPHGKSPPAEQRSDGAASRDSAEISDSYTKLQRMTSTSLEEDTADLQRLSQLLDPAVSDWPLSHLRVFVEVALECVKSRASKRPSMTEVMGRLEELLQLAQCHVSGILQDTPFNRKRHDPSVDVSAAIEDVLNHSTSHEDSFIPMVDDATDGDEDEKLRPQPPRNNEELSPLAARVVRECVVCLSAQPNTHLQPCNHAVLCHHCAQFLAQNNDPCPICRRPIESLQSEFETV